VGSVGVAADTPVLDDHLFEQRVEDPTFIKLIAQPPGGE
jgi:hypothetical protein